MGAKNHEVFTAAAAILFAACPHLDDVAQVASGNHLLDPLEPGTVARLVGDRQFHMMFFAGSDHLVGLGERPAHRLFQKDVGARLSTSDDHVAVRIEPAAGDADNLRLFLLQHFAVIGVGVFGTDSPGRGSPALFVFIRHRNNLDIVERFPHDVEAVAIVSPAGSANHRHAILLGHGFPPFSNSVGNVARIVKRARRSVNEPEPAERSG
ncbi:MAG: hypothetical protein KatS3mg105_1574 [Gemmatales bacterium]|nr:MAG: hypothetical protein KatS3mg105_1574 [Gemmatales bacterium]